MNKLAVLLFTALLFVAFPPNIVRAQVLPLHDVVYVCPQECPDAATVADAITKGTIQADIQAGKIPKADPKDLGDRQYIFPGDEGFSSTFAFLAVMSVQSSAGVMTVVENAATKGAAGLKSSLRDAVQGSATRNRPVFLILFSSMGASQRHVIFTDFFDNIAPKEFPQTVFRVIMIVDNPNDYTHYPLVAEHKHSDQLTLFLYHNPWSIESLFIAGAAAANQSQADHIGLLLPQWEWASSIMKASFTLGVQSICSRCNVSSVFISDAHVDMSKKGAHQLTALGSALVETLLETTTIDVYASIGEQSDFVGYSVLVQQNEQLLSWNATSTTDPASTEDVPTHGSPQPPRYFCDYVGELDCVMLRKTTITIFRDEHDNSNFPHYRDLDSNSPQHLIASSYVLAIPNNMFATILRFNQMLFGSSAATDQAMTMSDEQQQKLMQNAEAAFLFAGIQSVEIAPCVGGCGEVAVLVAGQMINFLQNDVVKIPFNPLTGRVVDSSVVGIDSTYVVTRPLLPIDQLVLTNLTELVSNNRDTSVINQQNYSVFGIGEGTPSPPRWVTKIALISAVKTHHKNREQFGVVSDDKNHFFMLGSTAGVAEQMFSVVANLISDSVEFITVASGDEGQQHVPHDTPNIGTAFATLSDRTVVLQGGDWNTGNETLPQNETGFLTLVNNIVEFSFIDFDGWTEVESTADDEAPESPDLANSNRNEEESSEEVEKNELIPTLARSWHGIAPNGSTRLLLYGGLHTGTSTNDCQETFLGLDFQAKSWEKLPSPPDCRYSATFIPWSVRMSLPTTADDSQSVTDELWFIGIGGSKIGSGNRPMLSPVAFAAHNRKWAELPQPIQATFNQRKPCVLTYGSRLVVVGGIQNNGLLVFSAHHQRWHLANSSHLDWVGGSGTCDITSYFKTATHHGFNAIIHVPNTDEFAQMKFAVRICGDREIPSIGGDDCTPCPENHFVVDGEQCTPCDAEGVDLSKLSVANKNMCYNRDSTPGVVGFIIVLVIHLLVAPTYSFFTALQSRIHQSRANRIAAYWLSQATANFEFGRLAYLEDLDKPTKIQCALKACANNLQRFRYFIPSSVYSIVNIVHYGQEDPNMEELVNDARYGASTRDDLVTSAGRSIQEHSATFVSTSRSKEFARSVGNAHEVALTSVVSDTAIVGGDVRGRVNADVSAQLAKEEQELRETNSVKEVLRALEPKLQQQPVTILVTNLQGFSSWFSKNELASTTKHLNRYFDEAKLHMQSHGGILENVLGDGLVVSFNTTARPLADHIERATVAGRGFIGHKAVSSLGLSCRIGMATRRVPCGVVGGETAKRYHIGGRVIQEATALSYTARNVEAGLLVLWTPQVASALSNSFVFYLTAEALCHEMKHPSEMNREERRRTMLSANSQTTAFGGGLSYSGIGSVVRNSVLEPQHRMSLKGSRDDNNAESMLIDRGNENNVGCRKGGNTGPAVVDAGDIELEMEEFDAPLFELEGSTATLPGAENEPQSQSFQLPSSAPGSFDEREREASRPTAAAAGSKMSGSVSFNNPMIQSFPNNSSHSTMRPGGSLYSQPHHHPTDGSESGSVGGTFAVHSNALTCWIDDDELEDSMDVMLTGPRLTTSRHLLAEILGHVDDRQWNDSRRGHREYIRTHNLVKELIFHNRLEEAKRVRIKQLPAWFRGTVQGCLDTGRLHTEEIEIK